MIIGTKEDIIQIKGIGKRIATAVDFLLSIDESIEVGKHVVDGDDVFVNVIETETNVIGETVTYEAHRQYIDLQYILSGEEIMVYAPISELEPTCEYNERDDYLLLTGKGKEIPFSAGDFYLVYPYDAHAPALGHESKKVKKAIAKIRV